MNCWYAARDPDRMQDVNDIRIAIPSGEHRAERVIYSKIDAPNFHPFERDAFERNRSPEFDPSRSRALLRRFGGVGSTLR